MTEGTTAPNPLDVTSLKSAPAPQLGSRRSSGTKVGSRAPAIVIATTSGEGTPKTPPMPHFSPISSPIAPIAHATTAANEAAAPAAAGPASATPVASSPPVATAQKPKFQGPRLTLRPAATPIPSGANTPGKNTPRGRSGSQQSSGSSGKRVTIVTDKKMLSVPTSPVGLRRSRSAANDDGSPAAGSISRSKYVSVRSTIKTIHGKSNMSTDVMSLQPPTPGSPSPSRHGKRAMSQAYAPTAVTYSNEESRRFQAEQRLGGKRVNAPQSLDAPWEHNQWKNASPKRAGSARPPTDMNVTAPWNKEGDGTHERSCRSHSAGAALRSSEAPYGVTANDHLTGFQKGDLKIVQHPRPAGARPTTGKGCSNNPGHHDILNPDAAPEKTVPSGRRPPPPSALAPSEEYVRPISRKQVEAVEHVERPTGRRGNPMATAPHEHSPFRSRTDDIRQACLSPNASVMGVQPSNPGKSFSKIFVDGRSGGVQSMHIDPNNTSALNSKFSPPRERPPTAKRNKSNIESVPGTDRDSLLKVDKARADRFMESLVGVMSPAPQRYVPHYDVVPPFWTADASN